MSERSIHHFGVVEDKGDFYEFHWSDAAAEECSLAGVIQTERGPRRTELAIISTRAWTLVSDRTIRELVDGMGDTERTKKIPILKIGINRLSPLIGRELAVLLWALMETASDSNIEAILHGWRELAREERWWLYAKGAAPGQRTGAGWRLALFHALSEMTDSRSAEPVTHEKKKTGSGSRSRKKPSSKKPPESRKSVIGNKKLSSTAIQRSSVKQLKSIPVSDLKICKKKNQLQKKVKREGRTATTTN